MFLIPFKFSIIFYFHSNCFNIKKILYIDLFSQYGHSNLNIVFISRFEKLGFELNYVLREGYINELGIDNEKVIWSIPEKFFNSKFGKLYDRWIQYKMLVFIKNNINTTEYELLFFSFFEEISFAIVNLKGNIVMMNHSNVSGLNDRIKLFFLRKSSLIGKILVFHESIKDRFLEFGIKNVIVEPLGLPKAINHPLNFKKIEELRKIDIRLVSEKLKFFIPTASKYNNNFVNQLISNPIFLNYLNSKDILLIIKDKSIISESDNIVVIDSFLSVDTYNLIFMISDSIILHYPESFEFKVSAVLFECFSNLKPVLLSNISSFNIFKEHINYNPFYQDQDQLMESIDELIKLLISPDKTFFFKNLYLLNPTLKSIFLRP